MKNLIIIFLSILFFAPLVHGRVFIDVGQAKVKPSVVGFPLPLSSSWEEKKRGLLFHQISQNSLEFSGLFDFISFNAFIHDPKKAGLELDASHRPLKLKPWQTLGADLLIKTELKIVENQIELTSYLYYVSQSRLLFKKTYKSSISEIRKLAYRQANDIIQNLTGKPSIFFTKILTTRRWGTKKSKEIFSIRWDGTGLRRISKTGSIAFSPAWSADGKKVGYTAFAYHSKMKSNNADIFVTDLKTKKTKLVSYRKGINSGMSFHPDGRRVVFSVSRNGRADIYLAKNNGNLIKRLTNGPLGAANISPRISPNGKKVAFVSDRSGRPMIYIMNINGSQVKRLTFAGRYNSAPAWAPNGRALVFSAFHKGNFDIFWIGINGQGLKKLTKSTKPNGRSANSENPSFAPSGRHIVFNSDRTGKNQLYVMSVDGSNQKRITKDGFSYAQPAWSPYIKE